MLQTAQGRFTSWIERGARNHIGVLFGATWGAVLRGATGVRLPNHFWLPRCQLTAPYGSALVTLDDPPQNIEPTLRDSARVLCPYSVPRATVSPLCCSSQSAVAAKCRVGSKQVSSLSSSGLPVCLHVACALRVGPPPDSSEIIFVIMLCLVASFRGGLESVACPAMSSTRVCHLSNA
jgi:hypothetical protein